MQIVNANLCMQQPENGGIDVSNLSLLHLMCGYRASRAFFLCEVLHPFCASLFHSSSSVICQRTRRHGRLSVVCALFPRPSDAVERFCFLTRTPPLSNRTILSRKSNILIAFIIY